MHVNFVNTKKKQEKAVYPFNIWEKPRKFWRNLLNFIIYQKNLIYIKYSKIN